MSTLILCVTAGRGPAECREAMAHIVDLMREEAAEHGLAFGMETEQGRASTFVSIDGEAADAFARSWEGSVQWVARSGLRPGHKRKNWFVAVHRLPSPPQLPEVKEADIAFETLRAGGPGGQHQNRTESAVRATHRPTGVSVVARDERSQHRNKALAVERLRALIAAVHERERNAVQFRQWLVRISVERGNPVRTFENGKLVQRQ
ncbi:peptide chain release factor H [Microvirga solisilvae]|uniref:peptide chain release factor H n=1 Tax=Microvirga solisilvae TaxID=2919498 RepID=UPI001FAF0EEF|nr:peptide chain release factor H [Microvirga solisilvae]